ncbi:rod shape-determining protein MreD [Candidatus Magnetaquicoccus inordinatus]|uniref:rod shape-determining protein MreD n=1 Tax=Candidatus Magnetaquicoccus inordinatus TaxID=2496818 RepID=UPI00102C0B52|nr:rod shape-determining protein MreD [Candidatus Magnetaquicoccus inordinatus]
MFASLLIAWIPALTLLLAVALQELYIPLEAWSVLRPDLLLIALSYWRLYRPDLCTIPLVFAIGLLVDLLSGSQLGLNAFTKLILLLLIGRFGRRLRALSFLHVLFGILFLSLLDASLQWLIMSLIKGYEANWPMLLGRPVATLLIAPLWASLLIYIHHGWLENV